MPTHTTQATVYDTVRQSGPSIRALDYFVPRLTLRGRWLSTKAGFQAGQKLRVRVIKGRIVITPWRAA